MAETRRSVLSPKRGPGGLGAKVKPQTLFKKTQTQRTSLLPRPDRIRYLRLAGAVRMGQAVEK